METDRIVYACFVFSAAGFMLGAFVVALAGDLRDYRAPKPKPQRRAG